MYFVNIFTYFGKIVRVFIHKEHARETSGKQLKSSTCKQFYYTYYLIPPLHFFPFSLFPPLFSCLALSSLSIYLFYILMLYCTMLVLCHYTTLNLYIISYILILLLYIYTIFIYLYY